VYEILSYRYGSIHNFVLNYEWILLHLDK
jgi:hypothetical protein